VTNRVFVGMSRCGQWPRLFQLIGDRSVFQQFSEAQNENRLVGNGGQKWTHRPQVFQRGLKCHGWFVPFSNLSRGYFVCRAPPVSHLQVGGVVDLLLQFAGSLLSGERLPRGAGDREKECTL
jgi:hypothetical protein